MYLHIWVYFVIQEPYMTLFIQKKAQKSLNKSRKIKMFLYKFYKMKFNFSKRYLRKKMSRNVKVYPKIFMFFTKQVLPACIAYVCKHTASIHYTHTQLFKISLTIFFCFLYRNFIKTIIIKFSSHRHTHTHKNNHLEGVKKYRKN